MHESYNQSAEALQGRSLCQYISKIAHAFRLDKVRNSCSHCCFSCLVICYIATCFFLRTLSMYCGILNNSHVVTANQTHMLHFVSECNHQFSTPRSPSHRISRHSRSFNPCLLLLEYITRVLRTKLKIPVINHSIPYRGHNPNPRKQ